MLCSFAYSGHFVNEKTNDGVFFYLITFTPPPHSSLLFPQSHFGRLLPPSPPNNPAPARTAHRDCLAKVAKDLLLNPDIPLSHRLSSGPPLELWKSSGIYSVFLGDLLCSHSFNLSHMLITPKFKPWGCVSGPQAHPIIWRLAVLMAEVYYRDGVEL